MKTWEMLRELSENPLLKFKDNSGSTVGISDKTGRVDWLNGDKEEVFVIYSHAPGNVDNLHLNWELVPEPVDFMTAINSEKNIRYENWVRYYRLGSAFEVMVGKSPVILREMLNGKWFVE